MLQQMRNDALRLKASLSKDNRKYNIYLDNAILKVINYNFLYSIISK